VSHVRVDFELTVTNGVGEFLAALGLSPGDEIPGSVDVLFGQHWHVGVVLLVEESLRCHSQESLLGYFFRLGVLDL